MKLERSKKHSSEAKLKIEYQMEVEKLVETLNKCINQSLCFMEDVQMNTQTIIFATAVGVAKEVLKKLKKKQCDNSCTITFPCYQLFAYFIITRDTIATDVNTTELRGLIHQKLLS